MSGLHLKRTAENGAEIDALAAALAADGGGRVGVDGMLPDLPGRLRPTRAPHPRLLGRKVTRAFTWEAADQRDREWWPQGITTSALTGLDERYGRDVLATSWYSKHGSGSRISVVDVERRRYGHVLLVTPTLEDGRAGLAPLKAHAGGIVWLGEHLHVAATGRGFFSCRLDDLMRVPAGSALETYGHRGHSDEGESRLRFSFFTVDRSGEHPALVVGEYGRGKQTRRLARFGLDPTSVLPLGDEGGLARPEIDERGEVRMQGVSVVDGTYYVTSSRSGYLPGSVYVRHHPFAAAIGPEDLV